MAPCSRQLYGAMDNVCGLPEHSDHIQRSPYLRQMEARTENAQKSDKQRKPLESIDSSGHFGV